MAHSLALSSTVMNITHNTRRGNLVFRSSYADVQWVYNDLSPTWSSLGLKRQLAYGSSVMMKSMWF